MWWSSPPALPPRRAVLAGLIALAGCGFSPVYAPRSQGAALSNDVTVVQSGGSFGFALTQALQNRLGPPGPAPRFRLTTQLSTSRESVAVTTAQSINRFNLIGNVRYTLTQTGTGNAVILGSVDGFNSYSAVGTSVATRAAELDAYDRLMVILADKIMADLLVAPGLVP
jgi:LPS-assembly lipoprotein